MHDLIYWAAHIEQWTCLSQIVTFLQASLKASLVKVFVSTILYAFNDIMVKLRPRRDHILSPDWCCYFWTYCHNFTQHHIISHFKDYWNILGAEARDLLQFIAPNKSHRHAYAFIFSWINPLLYFLLCIWLYFAVF